MYQAVDAYGSEHPNATLNNLVRSVRFTGGIGVVGVFIPNLGEVAFDLGMLWFKDQTLGTGQATSRHTIASCCA